jgi:clan AA aspartic protease
MGITYVTMTVKNPADPKRELETKFLVDSGAAFSVVPQETLGKLGIKPHRTQEFVLADGSRVKREIGDAVFFFEGVRGATPVVFGKKGDASLLGVFTLEALGLVLDPFKRTLKPAKMLLI